MERKIVYAGVCAESFGSASAHLKHLANLEISDERIRRATRRVGAEWVRHRNQRVQEFLLTSLPVQRSSPAGVAVPAVACVMSDGGRYQMLDRTQPSAGEHWKESRVAAFLELEPMTYEKDPTPELPEFLRSVSVFQRLAQIGRISGENSPDPEDSEKQRSDEPPWSRPKMLKKTMQASAVCWEEFGPIMATHAWHEGFHAAPAKVFVSDGSAAIEKVHRRHFSHYISVLDLMHALSYALAAARAATSDGEDSRRLYVQWAEWIWKGQVAQVISALEIEQQRIGDPPDKASREDPREVVRRARVYYVNHKSRMNYPEYRRRGFPITSAVMESSVKQINQRAKGSEKFWSPQGAEAILTLRADYLGDKNLGAYWKSAEANATGFRSYGTAG